MRIISNWLPQRTVLAAVGGGRPMPEETVKLLVLATEMRGRAEVVLARAETFLDEHARETMRGIAASYVKLAQRLEKGAGSSTHLRDLGHHCCEPG